jgi:aldose 1-epimerase
MPATGEQFEIVSGPTRAVVTEVGAGLRSLVVGARPLVETFGEQDRPPKGAGTVLVPWPNRVAGGRWTWEGAVQKLALTEPDAGNAIHGLLRFTLYRVGERSADAITLHATVPPQPGWPVPLATSIRYAVSDAGLTVTHTVTNVGAAAVPFGIGAHPYVRAGASATDDCTITISASTLLPLDGGIPTGPARPLDEAPDVDLRGKPMAGLVVDHAFGGCAPTAGDDLVRHRLDGPDGHVEVWAEPVFGYVQVFTPPEFPGRGRAVAIEPMTCPPDALNSGDGLITLALGETWNGTWGING